MIFNSVAFLLFAGLFFAFWPLCRRRDSIRWAYITAASFFFYGWWDWRFLFLLIGSGLIDFFGGLGMARFPRARRLFLVLSLAGNLGSLSVFKYGGFIAENLDSLFALLGFTTHWKAGIPDFVLILPVGISFYTFQSLSYTIDVYRGHLKPTRNILHFFAFISLFPQLMAGPIVRAYHLLPQLLTWRKITAEERWDGLRLIVHGFFKKVVIADNLAPVVNAAFGASVLSPSGPYWWVVVTMFAFQIYCDFSGYSDIARGLAKWMGYDFLVNFNHPYTSASFREFWRRWHISLSTWFRDYVYIPLGGSRAGTGWAHGFMWATMLASGLWHGAAWRFLVWSGLHALYLSVERLTQWPDRLLRLPGGRLAANLCVVVQVWIAWVFFRAPTVSQGIQIVKTMFSSTVWMAPCEWTVLALLGVAILREAYFFAGLDQGRLASSRAWRLLEPVWLAVIVTACVYLRGPGAAFIYFQF